ncbi:hypothetical protein NDU88_003746 [Pleurodeles waltl]|uniref:Uncharacterized protein n=1 Tax=Pleurodeles waltl TaxID=8319 RepID=A0AAV7PEQ2_PLEWA|nr:hypothetical protein NDU88_003746 [Pleurodeles waltl]
MPYSQEREHSERASFGNTCSFSRTTNNDCIVVSGSGNCTGSWAVGKTSKRCAEVRGRISDTRWSAQDCAESIQGVTREVENQ